MKRKIKAPIFLFLTLVLLAVSVAGCASSEETTATTSQTTTQTTTPAETTPTTRLITNLDGSVVEVPAEVTRVACIYGPSYEKVAILGAEDKVVIAMGFSSLMVWAPVIYDRYDIVDQMPSKSCSAPNIEELLEKEIQVCFFFSHVPDEIQKMKDVGIPCIIPNENKWAFDDIKLLLQVYAEVLGEDEQARAEEYCTYFDEKKAFVASRTQDIPESERPTVYFVVRKPLATAGKNSMVPELVDLAGGICVSDELDAGFGYDIVIEQLLEWDPEYIVLDHCGATYLGSAPPNEILADIAEDTRFDEMTAVKNDNVHLSPTGVFFWDAGQQSILQLIWLAKMLHPDKFEDVDMVTELKEYYSRFLNYDLTDDEAERILMHLPPA